MRQYVLWAAKEGRCIRIGASIARSAPIPFGVQVITLVEELDLPMMRRWCRKCARKGWSVEQMRLACGEEAS